MLPCMYGVRRQFALLMAMLSIYPAATSVDNIYTAASRVLHPGSGRLRGEAVSTRTLLQGEHSCPLPEVDMTKDRYQCVVWKKACVDQNVIVSYDPEVHPTTSMGTLPTLNVTEIMYNIPSRYGIGDRYRKGSALRFPALYVRPSNDMEEEEELRKPSFSNCTLPMLLYAHYPYNAAETYRYIFEKLVTLQEAGFFNRYVTLVPGVPPGSKVPSYTKFWYNSLSDRGVVSLSELSSRRPTDTPPNTTWEGTHVRCFEQIVGCRIRYDGYGLRFYNAGQYVVRHYMPHYLAQAASFEQRLFELQQVRIPDDPSILKIVFISRTPHQSAVGRTILNEAEIIQRCNNAEGADVPQADWNVPYQKYFCFAHVFGDNQLMDVWLMRQVDVILGMHGAGLTNSFYMKPGGSVIEVRPFGFSGRESWANRYARFKTSSLREMPWNVFWYGIDTFNASLSEPGIFEKEDKLHYSKFRAIKARDRHVHLTWPAFRNQLLNIAAVARTFERYFALRLCGAYYITDDVQPAELPGNDPHVDKARQRTFSDPDAERRLILKMHLSNRNLQQAATPDRLGPKT
ncbi:hypothetical protein VOLCADRAFT_104177 [Volvox carteri f. nagariensis]|uniref:Glycosyltransferase 61 catalytic domain-containing protein n=1 Tax=Volvox carteri f. nagariensis TaxID=3068 RepID=D8TRX9_VOLCA|nr:uncharacterized protein VOLCADRAFT_104177 [Volvox carteri f. nagariensis]EFJ49726.1 hypothetical protein VOLCADRAFT_104177 [Volvox carteri f. nagariensis]|eukprot:XP_002949233.1 hypothetical protein VOLCADRAFT_104177 [Volvox carteri f. nagariensis]